MFLMQLIGGILFATLSVAPVTEHKLVSTKRTAYGFESTLKLGETINDNRDLIFEIMHPDSSISFMVAIWPQEQEFAKGSQLSNVYFVADDTLSLNDKIVKKGTYQAYYPDSTACAGKASIAFYTTLPPNDREGFLLPDLKLEYGVLHPGDTVTMTDGLGNSAVCKIESMEIADRIGGRMPLPFLVPEFCTPNSMVSVLYSSISGSPMSEKISLQKN